MSVSEYFFYDSNVELHYTLPNNLFLNDLTGNPLPRVTWSKSGRLIDETYHILSNGTVRNEITFHNVDRTFLRKRLTCQATNTNLTRPVTTTVDVDMNCKSIYPLFYPKIQQTAVFLCQTISKFKSWFPQFFQKNEQNSLF